MSNTLSQIGTKVGTEFKAHRLRIEALEGANAVITETVQDIVGDMVSGNTENGIAVTYDDTTGKLNLDVNDPVITLAGDVTGSATMTNLGNVTITTTVAANSVALGTDTTGNYVADVTAGNYVLKSGTAGEGWSPTIAVDATNTNTASKVVARDASGNFAAGTITATLSGNSSTSTKLQTARTINGVSFDGSANITINAVDSTARIASSEKGVANGVATLDASGKVPSAQLPSYVDDVLEFTNLAGFPATGETGKIYVALDTNKTYRWSGSAYTQITSGAVDSVAGKTGVVTLTKTDVGLGNVDNTSDANKPVSTATQTALNAKQNTITGAATTITSSNLTASMAMVTDASGKVAAHGTVSATELGYLDGVTSAIQTQLDGKAATTHTHSISDVTGLQTALDGKAESTHTHSVSDITGLQTALDAKQDTLGFTPENTSNKGQPNGYVPLNSNGTIDPSYMPSAGGSVELKGPDTAVEVTQITVLIEGWLAERTYTVSVSGGTWTRNAGTIFWDLPTVLADTIHSITVTDVGYGSYVHEVNVLNVSTIADDSIINTTFTGDYPANEVEFSSPTYEQEVGDNDWKDYQAELQVTSTPCTVANSTTVNVPIEYTGTEVLVKSGGVVSKATLQTKELSRIKAISETYPLYTSVGAANYVSAPVFTYSYDGTKFYIFSSDAAAKYKLGYNTSVWGIPSSFSAETALTGVGAVYSCTALPNNDGLLVGSSSSTVVFLPFNNPATNHAINVVGKVVYTLTEIPNTIIRSIAISPDGRKLYVGATTIYQYTLTTPYDVSSRILDGTISAGYYICVSEEGDCMYFVSINPYGTSARTYVLITDTPFNFVGASTSYVIGRGASSTLSTPVITGQGKSALVLSNSSPYYVYKAATFSTFTNSQSVGTIPGLYSTPTDISMYLNNGSTNSYSKGIWIEPTKSSKFKYMLVNNNTNNSVYYWNGTSSSILTFSDIPSSSAISYIGTYALGKKMVLQNVNGGASVYTLATANDPTTRTLDFTFTVPSGHDMFHISEDGMYVFTNARNPRVYKYSLVSPYNFSAAWTLLETSKDLGIYATGWIFIEGGRYLLNSSASSTSTIVNILSLSSSYTITGNMTLVTNGNLTLPTGYNSANYYSVYHNGVVVIQHDAAYKLSLNIYNTTIPKTLNTSPGDTVYTLPSEKLLVAIDDTTVTAAQATEVPFVGYEEVNGDIVCKTARITVPDTARFVAYKTKHGTHASVLKAVKLNLWKV